jgi:hypothetical protein
MGKTAAEAFRTFTGIYSLFKCELLSANTKGIHDVCNDLCQSHLRICGRHLPYETSELAKRNLHTTAAYSRRIPFSELNDSVTK